MQSVIQTTDSLNATMAGAIENPLAHLIDLARAEITKRLADSEIMALRESGAAQREARRKAIEVIGLLLEDYRLKVMQGLAQGFDPTSWPDDDLQRLADRIYSVLYELGPIDDILRNEGVEDVAINGPDDLWVRDRNGWRRFTGPSARDLMAMGAGGVTTMFNQAISTRGQAAGYQKPIIDEALPSGHRLSFVVAPVAGRTPSLVIRRHRDVSFEMDDYLNRPYQPQERPPYQVPDYRQGWTEGAMFTPALATFLHMAQLAGLNITVLGPTGVGKTAFISMLGNIVPRNRRIIVCEDTPELRIRGESGRADNCAYYYTVAARVEGGVVVQMSDLVRLALRQRPDHLIIGEARGGEMFDLVQAMQTGHGGMIASVHAIGVDDLAFRAQYMFNLAGVRMGLEDVALLLSRSFNLAVEIGLSFDGRRYLKEIRAFTASAQGAIPGNLLLFQGGESVGYKPTIVARELPPRIEAALNSVGLSYRSVLEIDMEGSNA